MLAHIDPRLIITVVLIYFIALLIVAYYTSRQSDNDTFFIGNKKSNWLLVAFGMIGTSLSGVTFISVPGTVGASAFGYFQIVLGYFLGYFVVAFVLLPLYYRLQLTSIYTYLLQRLGEISYKTGASFFILSRTLGATGRLFIAINVLQLFVFQYVGMSFIMSTFLILVMILLYTIRGGVKTIVWTDTLQTIFMLLGLVTCLIFIIQQLGLTFTEALFAFNDAGYTKVFNFDPLHKGFFLKSIIGGALTTLTMTGLDQEMMQKNISVRTLGDSQKNMLSFSIVLVIVNFLFLMLGAALALYAIKNNLLVEGKPLSGDNLFPTVALQHAPGIVSLIFIIGLISALFPSADGALTALTSSTCIDLLDFNKRTNKSEQQKKSIRIKVHLAFTLLFFILVLLFKWIDDKSIIDLILKIASFTYGPLLGLFAFGMITNKKVNEPLVPLVCILSPILCFIFDKYASKIIAGYTCGLEILLINGTITFIGLCIISLTHKEKSAA